MKTPTFRLTDTTKGLGYALTPQLEVRQHR
jgi:hypothetical protein